MLFVIPDELQNVLCQKQVCAVHKMYRYSVAHKGLMFFRKTCIKNLHKCFTFSFEVTDSNGHGKPTCKYTFI